MVMNIMMTIMMKRRMRMRMKRRRMRRKTGKRGCPDSRGRNLGKKFHRALLRTLVTDFSFFLPMAIADYYNCCGYYYHHSCCYYYYRHLSSHCSQFGLWIITKQSYLCLISSYVILNSVYKLFCKVSLNGHACICKQGNLYLCLRLFVFVRAILTNGHLPEQQ